MVKLDQDVLLQLIGCFYLFAALIDIHSKREREREIEENENEKYQTLFQAYTCNGIDKT